MKNFKLITWYPNIDQIMWNDMGQYTFNFHKVFFCFLFFWEYICVFEYTSTLYSFSQIYSNLPLYKMEWNNLFSNLLYRLYSNIICKNIVKIFQKFEVGYTQTCTSLESSTMWHPKGGHCNVLSPQKNTIITIWLCFQPLVINHQETKVVLMWWKTMTLSLPTNN
jgi:hypothetical protein